MPDFAQPRGHIGLERKGGMVRGNGQTHSSSG
jgi:hypothetical protein